MKLSLTVEADAINVLALNMGRIAIDIDGIELADRIDVVCDNGYSLRIADAPGKRVVEDPFPPKAHLNTILCSTAHIPPGDNTILDQLSLQHHDGDNSDWILYTGYGYISALTSSVGGGKSNEWGVRQYRYDCWLMDKPETAIKAIIQNIDRSIWKNLMNKSGMLALMDAQARDEWYNSLEKDDIIFKRSDLIDKMNGIVARYFPATLPPRT